MLDNPSAAVADDDRTFLENYAGQESEALIASVLKDYKGRVALVSSFGAESSVLLHMVAKIDPSTPVIFLDTGKLFAETLEYRDALVKALGLTDMRTLHPDTGDLAKTDPDGTLNTRDTDACCHIRKTLPLERALKDFDAVLSGRKRFHGGERAGLNHVSAADGRLKVEPLAAFSVFDLKNYMTEHDLPSHPLVSRGYRSIGCEPCTMKGGTDENPRMGRWAGSGKTECGIHWTASGRPIRVTSPQPLSAAGAC
jgi:phosphoadenosine phosphosulfate reductase